MAAKSFSVIFTARDGVRVPMDVTTAQLRSGLLGGVNGQGQQVPGGWDGAECRECGEAAEWCPELRRALEGKPEGLTWVAERRAS
jgi:hypothetical protein